VSAPEKPAAPDAARRTETAGAEKTAGWKSESRAEKSPCHDAACRAGTAFAGSQETASVADRFSSPGAPAPANPLEALRALLPPHARTAVLGVGSELRRDDFAGSYAARLLGACADGKTFLAVEGGIAPENVTGVLRAFAPDAILVLDAAEMHAQPGTFALLRPEDITGATFSTHMLPLPVTLSYVEAACGCTTAYVGIQPVSTGQGIGMDARVRAGAEQLARGIAALLGCPEKIAPPKSPAARRR